MTLTLTHRRLACGLAGLAALATLPWHAATAQEPKLTLRTAVVRIAAEPGRPLSRLELPPDDLGFAGAERATADNATTGRFLGHAYETETVEIGADAIASEIARLKGEGVGAVVAIAEADDLLAISEAAGDDALVLNAAARDDRLRTEGCRPNLFHIAPSRAMLADGLAQYLVWKRWTEWLLIHGSHPQDRLMADAYRRSARKFGAEIVDELEYEDTGGGRLSDTGHVLVQRQIPVFTQEADEHDVVVIADESEVFGAYVPYRTWEPRPVAGDAGLRTRTWHPAFEGWGATQLQRRFERDQGRRMFDLDYQVWLALRVLGEAVTRTETTDPAALREHLRSDAFEIAGFKGQPLDFRPWNQQLRQGVLLADGALVVSVSPQAEFLHQRTRLDTLGYDEPESDCALE